MRTVYRYPYFMGGRANGRKLPQLEPWHRQLTTAHLRSAPWLIMSDSVEPYPLPETDSDAVQVLYELLPLIATPDTLVEGFVATDRLNDGTAASRALNWLCKRAGLQPDTH